MIRNSFKVSGWFFLVGCLYKKAERLNEKRSVKYLQCYTVIVSCFCRLYSLLPLLARLSYVTALKIFRSGMLDSNSNSSIFVVSMIIGY